MAKTKSWVEKLNNDKGLPKVEPITENMAGRWGVSIGDTVAIPSPKEVYDIMAGVPEGKLITTNEIRRIVARKHGATIGCPLTSGIFSWVAANAAEEIAEKEDGGVMPYWRTLKSDGSINEKYPGGIDIQKALLEQEGHTVVKKGKNTSLRIIKSR